MRLEEKEDFKASRKGIMNPDKLSKEERAELIRKEPAYGNIICRCEMITEGEIIDAIRRPLGQGLWTVSSAGQERGWDGASRDSVPPERWRSCHANSAWVWLISQNQAEIPDLLSA